MPMPRSQETATRRTPRMDRQVGRVLAVLRESPLTVPELAAALFIGTHSAGNYVRMLYAQKRIYIAGWQPREGNKPARMYSVGNHKDVHFTTKREPKPDTRVEDAKNRVLDLLALPQTVHQLSERAHLSLSRTRDLVRMLRSEKRVYVMAWRQPKIKGSQAPVYAVGNQPDCVRLRRATRKQKNWKTHQEVEQGKKALAFVIEAAQFDYEAFYEQQEADRQNVSSKAMRSPAWHEECTAA